MPSKSNVVKSFEKEARRRQLQKAKKSAKRNREARPPRRKDWLGHADEWDSYEAEERIMPRDERERRRIIEEMMVANDGEDAHPNEPETRAGTAGQVIEVSAGLCRVSANGQTVLCSLRGSLSAAESGYTNIVTVGDRVIISENGGEQGVIERVLPRRNAITRPDPFYSHLQQALAANVDQLLIVASWREPHLWPELIDRYLIAAQRSSVQPVLCVNKIDLTDSPGEIEAQIKPYRALGYPIILTSAARGDGLDRLQALLEGKVTVLAGLSGVGKSTLLSAI